MLSFFSRNHFIPCHLISIFERSFCNRAIKLNQINLEEYDWQHTRNFSIIAHVDHDTIEKDPSNSQILDRLKVERDRGITVKAQTAAMFYKFENQKYLLNLIDTPGHVDFSQEVVRSFLSSDTAILLVDANEGIQAQTVANFNIAKSKGLKIIPVINKIDLPHANVDRTKAQLVSLFGFKNSDIIAVSAKSGTNVDDILTSLILEGRCPKHPKLSENDARSAPLLATVIDSNFEAFRGCIPTVIIRSGTLSVGDSIHIDNSPKIYKIRELGIFSPNEREVISLNPGQIGFFTASIKTPTEVRNGSSIHQLDSDMLHIQNSFFIPQTKPFVYAGLFPNSQSNFDELRQSLEKLCLNDPSVTKQNDIHPALGAGFRLGFLGLLHMDVFKMRLEQEYNADIILTTPSVPYKVRVHGSENIKRYSGEWIHVSSTAHLPPENITKEYKEPYVLGTLITPQSCLQSIERLISDRRGIITDQKLIESENSINLQVVLTVDFPLNEIIVDFNDKLKIVSSGFASFDYIDNGWRPADLVRLYVHLNGKEISELTQLAVRGTWARSKARKMADLLVKEIPRQQFLIRIQVLQGQKPIASGEVKPYRKDVTYKLHAADPTRWKKLLTQQAEGKRKMRLIGNINVPRDTFINIFKKVDS